MLFYDKIVNCTERVYLGSSFLEHDNASIVLEALKKTLSLFGMGLSGAAVRLMREGGKSITYSTMIKLPRLYLA